ncbi:MAG: SDR family oxidoreductase [Thermoflavifilum sp.]|nr:SDR family oxidoreductase [Thermoflavifilum sp.]
MGYAFVTGASSGIGMELAYGLAKRNWNLLLIGRQQPALQQIGQDIQAKYPVDVRYHRADLSQPAERAACISWVKSLKVPLQILINNAGYGLWGRFDELSWQAHQDMLQVNVMALMEITHALLPELKQNPPAYILQVGSMAGYLPIPYMNSYAASKALVNQFTRALQRELRHTGIHVSLLAPGAVLTRFNERAGLGWMQTANRFAMPAHRVAEKALDGLFKQKKLIIPGISNRIAVCFLKQIPTSWAMRAAEKIYQPKD